MKKKKTYALLTIIVLMLTLGIGYAAISGITLSLDGNATIIADADFDVEYDVASNFVKSTSNTVKIDETNTVDAISLTRNSATSVTVDFTFNSENKSLDAVLPILNKSTELDAKISSVPSVTGVTCNTTTNSEYFSTLTADLYTNSGCTTAYTLDAPITAQTGIVYLKVALATTKTPVENITGCSFNVSFNATPIEKTA